MRYGILILLTLFQLPSGPGAMAQSASPTAYCLDKTATPAATPTPTAFCFVPSAAAPTPSATAAETPTAMPTATAYCLVPPTPTPTAYCLSLTDASATQALYPQGNWPDAASQELPKGDPGGGVGGR